MENANIQALLEKLKTAKSVKELIELAKAEGMEITAEKAEEMFARFSSGELSDDELEAASGGISSKLSAIEVKRMKKMPFDL